mmetsp:Transcript_5826/g.22124  ORF Transcript_5826/g.22124 Transcript_5826/m.22124 type:complete len:148 (-) Transcript_5826:303-746(-)
MSSISPSAIPPRPPSHCLQHPTSFLHSILLSLIFGYTGVDRLYLGHYHIFFLKFIFCLSALLCNFLRSVIQFFWTPLKLRHDYQFWWTNQKVRQFKRQLSLRRRLWIGFCIFVVFLSLVEFFMYVMDVVLLISGAVNEDSRGCELVW